MPDTFRCYRIVLPLSIGTGIAFVTGFLISLTVLPSATETTFKFRGGLIPFVDYKNVLTLRIAPDQTAYLRGVMFWGVIFASISMGCMVGLFVFLVLWQITTVLVQQLTVAILGAIIALAIHKLFVKSCRYRTSKAYYRFRPAGNNIAILARECGLTAATQGYVAIRIFKLLLMTIFYIGRLDTPFLYEGVGEIERCGFRFDNEPYVFRMDILQHEAHRHPYIETLGMMYMLKLKHGESVCSLAGSSWRLLFVICLMPWLSKYRAMRRPRLLSTKGDGASVTAPPLRAVSLADARGYALRAVSLIPVASGWAGGSLPGSQTRGEPEVDSETSESDDVRALRRENFQLRMQMRIIEAGRVPHPRDPPSPMLDHPRMPTISEPKARGGFQDLELGEAPASYRVSREDLHMGSPALGLQGLEDEEDGSGRSPSPPTLKRDSSAGLPSPTLKRNYSAGLAQPDDSHVTLEPAWRRDRRSVISNGTEDEERQVSWKNLYFEDSSSV